jgi:hypothetical protein
MPITARFLYLMLVITTVQHSSSQTCFANFIPVPASGSCPATRSCRTNCSESLFGSWACRSNCCGSCSPLNRRGECFAYTFGDFCSNTPISCPDLFDPLPTDDTGSRPSGSCPAWRPYQTNQGCCGACRTTDNTIMAYDCGTYCSTSPGPGCSSTVPGTSASPPPPLQRSAPPPPPGWGVSCAAFDGLSDSSNGTCTCKTTGWPFATGLQLECLGQTSGLVAPGVAQAVAGNTQTSDPGFAVGLRMDMQLCQDPSLPSYIPFTSSVMIPGAGWQKGEPGSTAGISHNIPTGVNLPYGARQGKASLYYLITMTGKADNIKLRAYVGACQASGHGLFALLDCTPLLTLVQIEDQSLGTCAPTVPLIAIASILAVCLLCGGLVCCCCCCRRKTEIQVNVRETQLREVASAAPYDTRLNEAFLSATRPSTQVPIAPLAAIQTVPGLPVFGADGEPVSTQVPIAPLAAIHTVPGLPVLGADGEPV